MAVGNVGETLEEYDQSDTFLSRDAGFTWEEVHKDAHLWEFGDSGSILIMANDEGPTDHVMFSTDEGLNHPSFIRSISLICWLMYTLADLRPMTCRSPSGSRSRTRTCSSCLAHRPERPTVVLSYLIGLPSRDAVDLLKMIHEIAKGVAYLHSKGVLHGDLKVRPVCRALGLFRRIRLFELISVGVYLCAPRCVGRQLERARGRPDALRALRLWSERDEVRGVLDKRDAPASCVAV